MAPFRAMCEQAAQALEQGIPFADMAEPARSFLASLEYERDRDAPGAAHRPGMLRAAAGFIRLFRMVSAEAPGLVCFGAEIEAALDGKAAGTPQRWSVSGTGTTLRAAFEGCIGEGIERLSLIDDDRHEIVPGAVADHGHDLAPATAAAIAAVVPADRPLGWVAATRLPDGARVWLPADLCILRGAARQSFVPPHSIGVGCAAGPSFDAAARHALLEVIERDAASLWWRGGARGRLLRLEDDANAEAARLLTQLRAGRRTRRSWLLDITSDLDVPCIAAVSSTEDGFGFACGLAARPTVAQAVRAALLEMCQMELAHQIVELKRRERGEAGFNEVDRAHLRRRREIDTRSCALLHPLPPALTPSEPTADPPPLPFGDLVGRLAARGIEIFALDLTRPALGVPVVHILCPALEKGAAGPAGPRLQEMIARTGGAETYTAGVPLM